MEGGPLERGHVVAVAVLDVDLGVPEHHLHHVEVAAKGGRVQALPLGGEPGTLVAVNTGNRSAFILYSHQSTNLRKYLTV